MGNGKDGGGGDKAVGVILCVLLCERCRILGNGNGRPGGFIAWGCGGLGMVKVWEAAISITVIIIIVGVVDKWMLMVGLMAITMCTLLFGGGTELLLEGTSPGVGLAVLITIINIVIVIGGDDGAGFVMSDGADIVIDIIITAVVIAMWRVELLFAVGSLIQNGELFGIEISCSAVHIQLDIG